MNIKNRDGMYKNDRFISVDILATPDQAMGDLRVTSVLLKVLQKLTVSLESPPGEITAGRSDTRMSTTILSYRLEIYTTV